MEEQKEQKEVKNEMDLNDGMEVDEIQVKESAVMLRIEQIDMVAIDALKKLHQPNWKQDDEFTDLSTEDLDSSVDSELNTILDEETTRSDESTVELRVEINLEGEYLSQSVVGSTGYTKLDKLKRRRIE